MCKHLLNWCWWMPISLSLNIKLSLHRHHRRAYVLCTQTYTYAMYIYIYINITYAMYIYIYINITYAMYVYIYKYYICNVYIYILYVYIHVLNIRFFHFMFVSTEISSEQYWPNWMMPAAPDQWVGFRENLRETMVSYRATGGHWLPSPKLLGCQQKKAVATVNLYGILYVVVKCCNVFNLCS